MTCDVCGTLHHKLGNSNVFNCPKKGCPNQGAPRDPHATINILIKSILKWLTPEQINGLLAEFHQELGAAQAQEARAPTEEKEEDTNMRVDAEKLPAALQGGDSVVPLNVTGTSQCLT
jgi:hypothetical protein